MSRLESIFKAYDVRGLAPQEVSPEVAEAIGAAFAQVIVLPDAEPEAAGAAQQTPIALIAHDMRESGPVLAASFAKGLNSQGVNALQLGLCSTDELYFASGALAAPGVMFTASHNPAAYNGAKFCRAGARPIGEQTGLQDIRRVAERWLDGEISANAPIPGTVVEQDMLLPYAEFLRSLVDLSGIRKLRVVVDAGNGMAGLTVPAVLETAVGLPQLPLEVIPLYFELDGTFPNHEANPLDPRNLRDLQQAVRDHGADIGIAFDGDADRCFIVDQKGDPVSPSSIAILVGLRETRRELAAGRTPVVVHNLITSRAVPEMLEVAGASTVRTRVGHSFIKPQMASHNAIFGGEHSAHYYFRDFFFADSGMLAAMHVLAELGGQPLPLSELARSFSPYPSSGEVNFVVEDAPADIARVRRAFTEGGSPEDRTVEVDDLDGLTVAHWGRSPRWWFNLRSSNTEPLLRLNVEAEDTETLDAVLTRLRGLIEA